MIQKLYRIERKLKEEEVTIQAIKDYRKQNALPILNEIETYLKLEKDKVLPKSNIGIPEHKANKFHELLPKNWTPSKT